jgi:prepilin-type N-terminal cleavage/methylation domain-containing protein
MKRRGFTLIELMVVIAIIIILAAIAIPNYLTMTARAKKSRVASDFAALATALETYRTDWGVYPTVSAAWQAVTTNTTKIYTELSTGGTGVATVNISGKTTAAGDAGPIVYMTSNILDSMKNPYNSANTYMYSSFAGIHWSLYASESSGTPAATDNYWSRTDATPTLAEGTGIAPATPTV